MTTTIENSAGTDAELLSLQVAVKSPETDGIIRLELVAPDGGVLPEFSAGSHVDLHLPNGLIRQYSICNSPLDKERYVLGVLKTEESRGGSIAVHDQIHEGDMVMLSKPRNLFRLTRAKKSILFAGGIGVTPILSMAEYLSSKNADFDMHYCTRSRDQAAFLQRLADAPYKDRVRCYFDNEPDSPFQPADVLRQPRPDTHIYICGPAGFMNFVIFWARKHGWPSSNIHVEYFVPDDSLDKERNAFQVKIASTGSVIAVPQEQTVLEALADHGIDIPCSCEQGVCGTCVTRVLEGEPEHRDSFLTDAEREKGDLFTPCCSRSRTPLLVLDL